MPLTLLTPCVPALHSQELVFFENSPRFPVDTLEEWLSDYVTLNVVVRPDDLGWPVRRERRFTWSCLKSKMIWVGPETTEAVQTTFASWFQTRVQLDGDVFAGVDDEGNSWQELQQLAARRKVYIDPAEAEMPTVLLQLLPPQVIT